MCGVQVCSRTRQVTVEKSCGYVFIPFIPVFQGLLGVDIQKELLVSNKFTLESTFDNFYMGNDFKREHDCSVEVLSITETSGSNRSLALPRKRLRISRKKSPRNRLLELHRVDRAHQRRRSSWPLEDDFPRHTAKDGDNYDTKR